MFRFFFSPAHPVILPASSRLRAFVRSAVAPATASAAATRREVRATAFLVLFVLGQCVLPASLLLEGAGAAEPRDPGKSEKNLGSLSTANRDAARRSAPPAWYAASQKRDRERIAQIKRGQAMLVAQDRDTGVKVERVDPVASSPDLSGAEAVSGPTLLREQFPGDVRASAALRVPNRYTSTLKLDLSNDRVPTEQEVSGQGAMCGALAPAAPAEPEAIAKQVDDELKKEGFDKGLDTDLPTPEVAQGMVNRRAAAPGLLAAATRLEQGKKKVRRARQANRDFALAMQKWDDNDFGGAVKDLKDYVKTFDDSPWTPEAMLHIADYAKFTGRPNEAEDVYKRVMQTTSDHPGNEPADMSFEAHQKAYERWADLYMLEGRYGEALPMLEDIVSKDTHWRRRTWAKYWVMEIIALNSDPRVKLASLDCGTKALAALLVDVGRAHDARQVAALQPKTIKGFSLADLQRIAGDHHLTLTGFRATPAQLAKLSLPVILHYSSDSAPVSANAPTRIGVQAGTKSVATSAARRKSVPTPSARYGHYVVVRAYNAKRGQWSVFNPQDGTRSVVGAKQLAREWSGTGLTISERVVPVKDLPLRALWPSVGKNRVAALGKAGASKAGLPVAATGAPGLKPVVSSVSAASVVTVPLGTAKMPAGALPVGVTRLSLAEMRRIVGTCFAVSAGSQANPRNASIQLRGPCGESSHGEPSVAMDPVIQNISIQDVPLWYSPAKGPQVEIGISYNSLDASNYNSITGNKWSFNYGSHITELPNKVTIYRADGAQDVFIPQSDGTYTAPRGILETLTKTAPSTYTVTTQGGDRTFYGIPPGSNGTVPFLLEMRDRWGYGVTLQYGVLAGKLLPFTVTDASGGVTRLQYDGNGHLIYAQTPDEKQCSFSYDANGNLIQCVDVAGAAFQYAYDDTATITQLNTAQGPWTFSYENVFGDHFKTTIYDPMQVQPVVVGFDNLPKDSPRYFYADHRGNLTFYNIYTYNLGYGSMSVVSGVTTPGNQIFSASYSDTDTKLLVPASVSTYISGLNSAPITTTPTYNTQGQLTQRRTINYAGNSGDRTLNLTYDPNGLDVKSAVASGAPGQTGPSTPTRLSQVVLQDATYNAQHQPLSMTDASGHSSEMTYTAWGAPQSVTTHEGGVSHVTSYVYGTTAGTPEQDRVVQVKYDGTLQSSYTYDASGRVASTTDATGLMVRYVYNNLDHLTKTLYPDGTSELVDYSCCSLPGVVTDRSGRKSYYDYDALKRLLRVQDADGQTLQFEYDGDGNRTGLLDASGTWTHWRYDGDDNVTRKVYADGTGESWSYSSYGHQVSSSTNGRGQVTNYGYTPWRQLNSLTHPSNSSTATPTGPVSLSYDALGRAQSMTDGVGTTTWGYDGVGRAAGEDGPWDNDTVSYGYDSLDRLSGMSVGRTATTSDATTLGYDSLSRLSSLSQNDGGANIGSWSWAYNGSTDQMLSQSNPNGTKASYGYEGTNTLKRLLSVTNSAPGGATLSRFAYAYGTTSAGTSNGVATGFRDNRISVSKQYGASASVQSTSYGYSNTSMLKSESAALVSADLPAMSQSYSFDAMGNRTQSIDGVAKTQTSALYNPLNQLTATSNYNTASGSAVLSSTSSYGYDNDGNMSGSALRDPNGVQVSASTYSYDEESRLTGIETSGQSKWQFVYDGLSRLRVSRSFAWQGGAWVQTSEVRRVYVGMDVVQERDAFNNVTASYTRTGNIGGILARTTTSSSTFYGYDLSGNVTTLTDMAGAQVGSYTYDAWGNTVASSGVRAGENPYRFSTKENIAGFYSYGFRFYASGLGRWINRDPISEGGGVNLYAMVGNNPVNYVDRAGLEPNGNVPGRRAEPFEAYMAPATYRGQIAVILVGYIGVGYRFNQWAVNLGVNRDVNYWTSALQERGYRVIVHRRSTLGVMAGALANPAVGAAVFIGEQGDDDGGITTYDPHYDPDNPITFGPHEAERALQGRKLNGATMLVCHSDKKAMKDVLVGETGTWSAVAGLYNPALGIEIPFPER